MAYKRAAKPRVVSKPRGVVVGEKTHSEAEIQKAIISRLVANGWLTVRFNGGGFKSSAGSFVKFYLIAGLNAFSGFPDVVAFGGADKGGRFLMIEVKDHKGKVSKTQETFHRFAARFGIVVHVLRHPRELDAIWNVDDDFYDDNDE